MKRLRHSRTIHPYFPAGLSSGASTEVLLSAMSSRDALEKLRRARDLMKAYFPAELVSEKGFSESSVF